MRASICLWLVLAACGGGGGGGDGDGGDGGDDGGLPSDGGPPDGTMGGTAPMFDGVTVAYADGVDRIGVQWNAAVDDVTPSDAIVYRLYTGATPQDAEMAMTPEVEVTGSTEAAITGLSAGQTLYVVAIAVDGDGNASTLRRPVKATTTLVPTVVRKPVKDLSKLSLTISELGHDRFALTGADAATIAANDLIVVDNTFGRSLRRVVTTMASGGGYEITTTKADMMEVFQSGELITSTLLAEPMTAMAHEDGMEELEDGVTLSYEMSFDPVFEGYMKFSDSFFDKPEKVRFTAEGVFAVKGLAAFQTSGSKEYDNKVDLASRTMRFVYVVGGVPVYQEVILTLVGEVELSAETNFTAQMNVDAQKTIKIGFEWDQASGFQTIREDGFMETTTFTLDSQAKASATIKIYPVIKTRLYKMLAVGIEVVPQVNLEAEARFLPLPPELTKLDVDFFVDAQVFADLSIFSKNLWRWESDRYELYRVPLFSLPDVKLHIPVPAGNTCHPTTLFLQVQDGYNNKVLPPKIGYRIDPPGPVLTLDAGRVRGTIESMTPGTYTIEASVEGDSFLGPIGTRYSTTTVTFTDPGVDCMMVPPPTSGTGFSCTSTQGGLVAPPYFESNRFVIGSDSNTWPSLVLPTKSVSFASYTWAFASTGKPYNYNWDADGNPNWPIGLPSPPFAMDLKVSFNPPFGLEPGHYVPSNIAFGHSVAGCDSQGVNGECVAYGAPSNAPMNPGDPLIRTGVYEVSASKLGPDATTSDDEEHCYGDTSIPVPVIEVVGPADPYDNNDDPKHARHVTQFVRFKERLPAGDKDFFRWAPSGSPTDVTFDGEPLEMGPTCYVRVKTTTPNQFVKPTITVYRGEQNAANDTNVVVKGLGEVTFAAIPTEVYFARMSVEGTSGVGDYVGEIVSDCTAETQFPAVTAPIMASATTIAPSGQITLSTTVDSLTEEAHFQLVTPSEGFGSQEYRATIDPVTKLASATFPGPTTAGTYVAKVRVATLTPDPYLEHQSTYVVDPSFSSTHYTVEQVNYAAGDPYPRTRRLSTIPVLQVTVGP